MNNGSGREGECRGEERLLREPDHPNLPRLLVRISLIDRRSPPSDRDLVAQPMDPIWTVGSSIVGRVPRQTPVSLRPVCNSRRSEGR